MKTSPPKSAPKLSRNYQSHVADPNLTFVMCVESGPLEQQTVHLVESLRKWGGRFANCPVIAITPRKGFPLTRKTMNAFEKHSVDWHMFEAIHNASWYNPMNKPAALAFAEEIAITETIVWLDSDTLVIGEPTGLNLSSTEEFAAMPGSSRFDIASTGENDSEMYWAACLNHNGIDTKHYPWIHAQPGESGMIRMYWQGGAFAYQRNTKLGAAHLASSQIQINSLLASKQAGAYFTEQIGLALSVHQLNLDFRTLPASHNFTINALAEGQTVDESAIRDARIIHYFGSLWPNQFDAFVSYFKKERPDVAEWLRKIGPLADNRNISIRFLSKLQRRNRQRDAARFLKSCEVV